MDYIWPLNFLNLTCAQLLNNHQNRFTVPVANFLEAVLYNEIEANYNS